MKNYFSQKKFLSEIALIIVVLISALVISLKYASFNNELPQQYKNYKIIAKYILEINGWSNGDLKKFNAKLLLINDTEDFPATIGRSRIILLRDDGYFFELPGYGEGFEWWKVGNLTGSSRDMPEIAVLYQNTGSGSFEHFYFYRWNGENFEIALQNEDLFNDDKLEDLDADGNMEIIHTYRLDKFAFNWKDIYKWNSNKNIFQKANNLFPEFYKTWLDDLEKHNQKEFSEHKEFYDSPQSEDVVNLNECLKEKATLNSTGVFADAEWCL